MEIVAAIVTTVIGVAVLLKLRSVREQRSRLAEEQHRLEEEYERLRQQEQELIRRESFRRELEEHQRQRTEAQRTWMPARDQRHQEPCYDPLAPNETRTERAKTLPVPPKPRPPAPPVHKDPSLEWWKREVGSSEVCRHAVDLVVVLTSEGELHGFVSLPRGERSLASRIGPVRLSYVTVGQPFAAELASAKRGEQFAGCGLVVYRKRRGRGLASGGDATRRTDDQSSRRGSAQRDQVRSASSSYYKTRTNRERWDEEDALRRLRQEALQAERKSRTEEPAEAKPVRRKADKPKDDGKQQRSQATDLLKRIGFPADASSIHPHAVRLVVVENSNGRYESYVALRREDRPFQHNVGGTPIHYVATDDSLSRLMYRAKIGETLGDKGVVVFKDPW